MEEKLVIRLSNNLGNQMFMYSAGYAAAKRLKKKLYYDKISAYSYKNKIHKFSLENFNITSNKADYKDLYVGPLGNLKRKILKKIDNFKSKQQFIVETYQSNKRTFFTDAIFKKNFCNKIFMEGYFESEKYFITEKDNLIKEFSPKNIINFKKCRFLADIKNTESVALCIRKNRFNEKIRKTNNKDKEESLKFVKEQIQFIFNAITFFKSRLSNPIFYLWSNSFDSLSEIFKNEKIIFINNQDTTDMTNKIHLDLFLMNNCKHYAVIPSAFNWWGCWLSKNINNLVLRPGNKYFNTLKIKNRDYWPSNWKEI